MVPLRRVLTGGLISLALVTSQLSFAAGNAVELRGSWSKGKEHWLLHIQPAQPGFAIGSNSPAFNNKDLVKIVDATTGQPVEFKIHKPTALRTVRFVELAFPTLTKPTNISVIANGFVIVDQRGRNVAYNERFAVRAPPAMAGEMTPRPSVIPRTFSYASASPAPTGVPREHMRGFAAGADNSPQPRATAFKTEMATPPPNIGEGAPPPEPPPVSEPPPTKALSGAAPEIKAFPFPPPPWSTETDVPRNLLVGNKDHSTLGDVGAALMSAFQNREYDATFYSVPNGFALASQLEQINPDGTAAEDRWVDDAAPMAGGFSIKAYLQALFRAREGHSRVIVFVVTDQPIEQTEAKVSPTIAEGWADGGASKLPKRIEDLEFTNDYACTALIYEFESLGGGQARQIDPSEIAARDHLEKSGLIGELTSLQH